MVSVDISRTDMLVYCKKVVKSFLSWQCPAKKYVLIRKLVQLSNKGKIFDRQYSHFDHTVPDTLIGVIRLQDTNYSTEFLIRENQTSRPQITSAEWEVDEYAKKRKNTIYPIYPTNMNRQGAINGFFLGEHKKYVSVFKAYVLTGLGLLVKIRRNRNSS